MPGTKTIDLDFRPASYESETREMDFPIRAEAPFFGGGGYLPKLAVGEVSIAGVALASTTGDLISVRAKPVPQGIRYRIVDEYKTRFKIEHPVHAGPLSLSELVALIDTVEFEGLTGLVTGHLDMLWEGQEREGDPGDLGDYALVSSPFYLELTRVYERKVKAWVRQRRRDQGNSRTKAD